MSHGLLINIVGTAAALCSMTSFAPQLIKIIRERDAEGVSLRMYIVTAIGFCLWVAYGLLIGQWPVVASNAVCLAMSSAILVFTLRYADKSN